MSSRYVDELVDHLVELDADLKQILVGGPRRTISAELGRRLKRGEASRLDRAVCELLDVFEDSHCLRSHERERPRRRRRRRAQTDLEILEDYDDPDPLD